MAPPAITSTQLPPSKSPPGKRTRDSCSEAKRWISNRSRPLPFRELPAALWPNGEFADESATSWLQKKRAGARGAPARGVLGFEGKALRDLGRAVCHCGDTNSRESQEHHAA